MDGSDDCRSLVNSSSLRGDFITVISADIHSPQSGWYVPPALVQNLAFIINFKAVAVEMDAATRVYEFRGRYQVVWDVWHPESAPSSDRQFVQKQG